MANGRSAGPKKGSSNRDGTAFLALPWQVLDCPAYGRLSYPARALLLEVGRQYHRDDNGRMLLSRAYLATRGWRSADVIHRAKTELLEGGFIFETVKGHRPNKASWYAATWLALDRLAGFDPGAERAFERGAYRREVPLMDVTRLKGYDATKDVPDPTTQKSVLIPAGGTESRPIGPAGGTERPATVPPAGPIRPVSGRSPVPPAGHPLDLPSEVQQCNADKEPA